MYRVSNLTTKPTIYCGGLEIGLRGIVGLIKHVNTDFEQLKILHALLSPMHQDFDLRAAKELLEHVRTAMALKDVV